jgi:hypothetical protein
MQTILAIFALVVMQVCAHAGIETDIPPTNRVVLKSGAWTPTPEQTQKALLSIQTFLNQTDTTNSWKNAEIKKIRANTKNYRVQFIGILHDGKRVVWCNFFPARGDGSDDEFQYWKQQEVRVDDGGYGFWQIDYDPDTDRCSEFASNGYA